MRRVVCIVIALLVLAPTLALGHAFRCKATGEMHARCCCPGSDEVPEDTAPQISSPCCCDVIAAIAPDDQERSAQTSAPPHLAAPSLIPVAVPVELAPPTVVALAPITRSGAPPAPPDPIFLRTCSLLL